MEGPRANFPERLIELATCDETIVKDPNLSTIGRLNDSLCLHPEGPINSRIRNRGPSYLFSKSASCLQIRQLGCAEIWLKPTSIQHYGPQDLLQERDCNVRGAKLVSGNKRVMGKRAERSEALEPGRRQSLLDLMSGYTLFTQVCPEHHVISADWQR